MGGPILEGRIVWTCSCLESRTDRKCSWIGCGNGMKKRELKEARWLEGYCTVRGTGGWRRLRTDDQDLLGPIHF